MGYGKGALAKKKKGNKKVERKKKELSINISVKCSNQNRKNH